MLLSLLVPCFDGLLLQASAQAFGAADEAPASVCALQAAEQSQAIDARAAFACARELHWELGQPFEKTLAVLRKAADISKDSTVWYNWAFSFPAFFASYSDVLASLQGLAGRLDILEQKVRAGELEPITELSELYSMDVLFSLGHLGELAAVTLLQRIAGLIGVSAPFVKYTAPNIDRCDKISKRASARVRVGFSSPFYGLSIYHASLRMCDCVMSNLDKHKFHLELIVADDPTTFDVASTFAQRLFNRADHYTVLSRVVQDAQRDLAALELDVLVFIENGMNLWHYVLALGRYAPVQVLQHGHMFTSGSPGISHVLLYGNHEVYRLGGQQNWWSERVVNLRGPLPYFDPYAAAKATGWDGVRWLSRAEVFQLLGLHDMALRDHGVCVPKRGLESATGTPTCDLESVRLYVYAKKWIKMHPLFDEVFLRILEKDPSGILMFCMWGGTGGIKLATIERVQSVLGPRLGKRARWYDGMLAPAQWVSVLTHADALLDSWPHGGTTTAMEIFSLGRPCVTLFQDIGEGITWPNTLGPFPTRDHLLEMGITEMIASSFQEYAEIAVRLATNSTWQAAIRKRVRERSHSLFDRLDVMPAWEAFLEGSAGRCRGIWDSN